MLKAGDVVRLRSGGPDMTIVSVKDDTCECTWFKKDELGHATFPAALLRLRTDIDKEQSDAIKAAARKLNPRSTWEIF
ncbi:MULTISPECIES: YodC family protein [Aeromonas]|nr:MULTISPECIES: DUF2158 domain-containing protein [Aeromonas]